MEQRTSDSNRFRCPMLKTVNEISASIKSIFGWWSFIEFYLLLLVCDHCSEIFSFHLIFVTLCCSADTIHEPTYVFDIQKAKVHFILWNMFSENAIRHLFFRSGTENKFRYSKSKTANPFWRLNVFVLVRQWFIHWRRRNEQFTPSILVVFYFAKQVLAE